MQADEYKIQGHLKRTLTLFSLLIFLVCTSNNFIRIYKVSGRSMEPTIQTGEYVVVIKKEFFILKDLAHSYINSFISEQKPSHSNIFLRNDILLVKLPNIIQGKAFGYRRVVKRNYALPGETVFITNSQDEIEILRDVDSNLNSIAFTIPHKSSQVDVNKGVLPLWRKFIRYGDINREYVSINNSDKVYFEFKSDHYFLLGDNEKASIDSRHWGVLPQKYIIGKVIFIFDI